MTWMNYLVAALACMVPPLTGLLAAWAVDCAVWGWLIRERR